MTNAEETKTMEEIAKELHEKAALLEGDHMVTAWMKAEASCGETSCPNCATNAGWCAAEVRRLVDKGVHSLTVRLGQDVAVFRYSTVEEMLDIQSTYRRLNAFYLGDVKGAAE